MAAISPEQIKDIAARGQALYDAQIKPLVEEQNKGKFLVLDVETGDYEIDADELLAMRRMVAKKPEAMRYLVRVGYKTAHRIGFSPREGEE